MSTLNVESRQEAFAFTMAARAKASTIGLRTAMVKKNTKITCSRIVCVCGKERLIELKKYHVQRSNFPKRRTGGSHTIDSHCTMPVN